MNISIGQESRSREGRRPSRRAACFDELAEQGGIAYSFEAGTPPQFAYAYKKTGLLGIGDQTAWPADRRKEWNDAIEEYFLIEAASARSDKPDPNEWNTEIPELLISGFNQQDLDRVREILRAIAPIEGRQPGLKVVQRIELAAVFLAPARLSA